MNIPLALRDSAQCLGVIEGSGVKYQPLTDRDIRQALCRPVWDDNRQDTVFSLVRPGESVCLVVSDHTRRTATDTVLPIIIDGLTRGGCSITDMFILVASGIHRSPSPAEIDRILGEETASRFKERIFLHNADDDTALVCVGTTKRGHEVRVNRRAIEADRLILLGAAGYHYHAGFGGGRKSLVPGLASRGTIAYNHSLTLDPSADRIHPMVDIGILEGNPVSEEMLEGALMCEPDIIINTVLTPSGALVGIFSGGLDCAHRAACRMVEEISRVNITEQADIVLASAGSAQNWIQSHKALVNANRAMKEGGVVILLAPCPEGLGDERFRHWVSRTSIGELYSELRRSPEVLGQTALSSRIRGANAILVTALNSRDITDLGIRTALDDEAAVKQAIGEIKRKGAKNPTYYSMPEAVHTVPFVKRG